MSGKKNNTLQKAKKYCFLLLKFRPRSEQEIYNRLKQKEFDEEIIQAASASLKAGGFINDNYFAQLWIAARLKKPYGLRRIKQELKLKGVSDSVIESNISKIKSSYSEEDAVIQTVKAQLSKFAGGEPDKLKKRLYGYLLRRGFSPETVIEVISELIP